MGKKRVLVVDDTPSIRELIYERVQLIGYDVCEVSDGENAINYLRDGGMVEAIITDYQMPKVNGEELTRRIKEIYPWIRVIFISSNDLQEFETLALRAGADEVYQKSDFIKEISVVLNRLIGPPEKKEE